LQNDVAPTSIASPPTTTVPPTPGRPNILVAATGDNKIVRLDPQTGRQLKVLVDLNGRLTPGPASGDIQVTACCVAFDSANGLVYYGWGKTISSVPADGGAESVRRPLPIRLTTTHKIVSVSSASWTRIACLLILPTRGLQYCS
jgi:hypothetical protein